MEQADTFIKVIRLEEVEPGRGHLVRAGLKKLALFLHEGELHCIQNYCPHAGAALALGPVSDCIVRCPRHSWGFNFVTGECKTNSRYSVKRYETRVEDGWVLVGLPEGTA